MTVPVVAPSSTKSPEEKGRVMSSVKPAKTFESVFCSESEKARPATESTATSEAEGMLSLSAIMSATSTQSSTRTQERMKLRMARSSLERSRARRTALVSSLMTTREMSRMTAAASRLPSEKPPISVSSSFCTENCSVSIVSSSLMSGMVAPPFQKANPLYTRPGGLSRDFVLDENGKAY